MLSPDKNNKKKKKTKAMSSNTDHHYKTTNTNNSIIIINNNHHKKRPREMMNEKSTDMKTSPVITTQSRISTTTSGALSATTIREDHHRHNHHNHKHNHNHNKTNSSDNTNINNTNNTNGGSSSSTAKAKQDHPITVVYEALLNTRKVISCLDVSRYQSDLFPAINRLVVEHIPTLSRQSGVDLTECQQAFQALRSYHHMTTGNSRAYHGSNSKSIVKIVTLLDDCYYTLYYCLSGSGGDRGGRNLSILPPHIYFTHTMHTNDVKERSSAIFQSFITRNISDTGVARLRQIWGFDITSSSSTNSALMSPVMKKNPLLQLHFLRWKESICLLSILNLIPKESEVFAMIQSCKPQVLSSPSSATMKGTDPLLPDFIREYNDSCRIWSCRLYAFATPNLFAIQRLLALAPLIEIGAGTGYWSHMVRTHSQSTTAVVHCYDKDPPSSIPNHSKTMKVNEYHGKSKSWTNVLKGGPEVIEYFPTCTLFLCYPPPDSPMALLSLRAYTGDCVCYVGEWQGDTGTKAFEKLLCETFICEEVISLPNWGDTCYMMMIWKRRKEENGKKTLPAKDIYSNHVTFPFLCSYCGNNNSTASDSTSSSSLVPMSSSLPLQRCRLSYNVYFCSTACAIAGRNIHLEELAMKCLLQLDDKSDNTISTNAVNEDNEDASGCSKKRKLVDNRSSTIVENSSPLIALTSAHFVRVQSPRYPVKK